jgi:hypothetical protein
MVARDKHSSLLRKSVNYGQKQFYNIGPGVSGGFRTLDPGIVIQVFYHCAMGREGTAIFRLNVFREKYAQNEK